MCMLCIVILKKQFLQLFMCLGHVVYHHIKEAIFCNFLCAWVMLCIIILKKQFLQLFMCLGHVVYHIKEAVFATFYVFGSCFSMLTVILISNSILKNQKNPYTRWPPECLTAEHYSNSNNSSECCLTRFVFHVHQLLPHLLVPEVKRVVLALSTLVSSQLVDVTLRQLFAKPTSVTDLPGTPLLDSAVKGESKRRSAGMEHKIDTCQGLFCTWFLVQLVRNSCSKVVKTWLRVLLFCAQWSVSVTSWTRSKYVTKRFNQLQYALSSSNFKHKKKRTSFA